MGFLYIIPVVMLIHTNSVVAFALKSRAVGRIGRGFPSSVASRIQTRLLVSGSETEASIISPSSGSSDSSSSSGGSGLGSGNPASSVNVGEALDFYTLSSDDLTAILKSWGQPAFRAKQIREWVFDKGVTQVEEMKNLPKALRHQISDHFAFGSLHTVSELISKDGTIKRAYSLRDGQLIESVLMPYRDGRRTACISSQAGCAMG
jgi:hypothetical protein